MSAIVNMPDRRVSANSAEDPPVGSEAWTLSSEATDLGTNQLGGVDIQCWPRRLLLGRFWSCSTSSASFPFAPSFWLVVMAVCAGDVSGARDHRLAPRHLEVKLWVHAELAPHRRVLVTGVPRHQHIGLQWSLTPILRQSNLAR